MSDSSLLADGSDAVPPVEDSERRHFLRTAGLAMAAGALPAHAAQGSATIAPVQSDGSYLPKMPGVQWQDARAIE